MDQLGGKLVVLLMLHFAVVRMCQPGCQCEVESFGLFDSFSLTKVDCSGVGPDMVPVAIPLDTSSLDLSSNSIRYIEDSVLSGPGYTTLSSLDLSYNLISSINNATFSKLRYLETLDLSHNSIEIFQEGCFSGLPLVEVDLSYNQIREVHLNAFSFRTYGRPLSLDLSNNSLVSVTKSPRSHFPNIQSLNLSGNKLSSVPDLRDISLRFLNLAGNPISIIDEQSFAGLKDLSYLWLCEMPLLHTIEPKSFHHLQNLQLLDLSQNPNLKSLSEDVFTGLQLLQELNLSNSGVTSLPTNILKLLPSIKNIVLRDQINCWKVYKQEPFNRNAGKSNAAEKLTCDLSGIIL